MVSSMKCIISAPTAFFQSGDAQVRTGQPFFRKDTCCCGFFRPEQIAEPFAGQVVKIGAIH